jgi:RNA polymerase sigma factor (sigma-70 family)
MKHNHILLTQLFRTEFRKIVSVLCKSFGLENIQLAEDIASDTFLKATETWGLKGVPDNPTAWLYKVAKNVSKDHFRRENNYSQKIIPELNYQNKSIEEIEIDLSENNIEDSQLQMIFSVCNPTISKESQITFALRILCGFGIKEIANALLTNKATINKRLLRVKEHFRTNKINLQLPLYMDLEARLNNVLSIVYLLFNEGYYSSSSEKTIQKELCIEAMRLLYMVLNHKSTNLPQTNALMALFCFQSSRFDARVNNDGESILYENQDRNKWNPELIEKGEYYLKLSSIGKEETKYHLEAVIGYWHTRLNVNENDKWNSILQLYNRLIQIEYSPIIALNRTYALSKVIGKEKAITEALKIDLKGNHLYHVLLSELFNGIDKQKQIRHLKKALEVVDTKNEERIILKKLELASR